jgi:hypothetical protein
MTQDMIELAKKAGIPTGSRFVGGEVVECLTLEVQKLIELVAAHTLMNIDPSSFMSYQEGIEAGRLAEREACAEMCKKHADVYGAFEPTPSFQAAWAACIDLRDQIRARGEA